MREVPCPRTDVHEPHDSDTTPGNPGSPLGPFVRCPGIKRVFASAGIGASGQRCSRTEPHDAHYADPRCPGLPDPGVTYDRGVLVDVVIYHYRDNIKGCGCGWSVLGASWAEHIAQVYEESVLAKVGVVDA